MADKCLSRHLASTQCTRSQVTRLHCCLVGGTTSYIYIYFFFNFTYEVKTKQIILVNRNCATLAPLYIFWRM